MERTSTGVRPSPTPHSKVKLPTYAFQRQRYWPDPDRFTSAMAIGQAATDHPLLGAMVDFADERRLFTGRVSLESFPWLADHVVLGSVLLPGTAFVDLVLCAGECVGCPALRELVLEAPLLLSEGGGVQLQFSVGEPDEFGLRSVGVYSRPERGVGWCGGVVGEWVRHASGVLAPAEVGAEGRAVSLGERLGVLGGGVWPPDGAEVVPVDGLYDALVELGFEYGPAFQGLRAAWRRGRSSSRRLRCRRSSGRKPLVLVCIRRCWMRRFMSV